MDNQVYCKDCKVLLTGTYGIALFPEKSLISGIGYSFVYLADSMFVCRNCIWRYLREAQS